mgnify:CR=1 FL=1
MEKKNYAAQAAARLEARNLQSKGALLEAVTPALLAGAVSVDPALTTRAIRVNFEDGSTLFIDFMDDGRPFYVAI